MNPTTLAIVVGLIILVLYIMSSIKVLSEYERAVVFTLGRLDRRGRGPGVVLVFGPIQRMVRVDLRQQALEVPPTVRPLFSFSTTTDTP